MSSNPKYLADKNTNYHMLGGGGGGGMADPVSSQFSSGFYHAS